MKRTAPTSLAENLAALGEPVRLRLLRLVERQELSVGEIGRVVQMPQSTISRHLKVLAEAGWISRRTEGTATLYRLVLDDLPPRQRAVWTAVREQLAADRLSPEIAEDEQRLVSVLAERREDSQSFFGRVAGLWDDYRNELFGGRFTPIALLSFLRPDWVVADLGCGTGNAAELLSPLVARVVAVDQSVPMLKAAQQRLAGLTNVEFVQGQIENLPLPSKSVDAAVCLLVLHHVENPGAACAEIHRILKPGGVALIVDMVSHERAEFRQKMGHRWLGFSEPTMLGYLESARFDKPVYWRLPSDTEARGPGLFVATATATDREKTPTDRPGDVEK